MHISHHVSPIRQPNINDCWATATAMVLRLNGISGVTDIKRRAASVRLNHNGSIPSTSVNSLATALGLNFRNLANPPLSLSPGILARALRHSCAAAFGQYNYPGAPNATNHVLLFYSIQGRDENPMVYFIDPYTGRRYNYLVDEINQSLGSVDYMLYS